MPDVVRPVDIDNDRYDRSRRIGWLDLEKVSKARILMVGAGALGNEVSKDLVLSGFRRITVVDMDRVIGSNLNRCLFFTADDVSRRSSKAEAVTRGMKTISSEGDYVAVVDRIENVSDEVFRMTDIVIGCLDNVQARIHVNSHSYHFQKPLVDGGMDGFVGKVMVVRPPAGACLQCGMNRTHAKVAALRYSCTGKDVVFHEPRVPAEITTTSIISAIMVREVLKIVSGRPEMLLNNTFYYDGERNVTDEMEVEVDPDCQVHLDPSRDYR